MVIDLRGVRLRALDRVKVDAKSAFIMRGRRFQMARKIRSDITVGSLEKKLGVSPGTFRNPNGRDTRSDKKLGTLRKEAEKSEK